MTINKADEKLSGSDSLLNFATSFLRDHRKDDSFTFPDQVVHVLALTDWTSANPPYIIQGAAQQKEHRRRRRYTDVRTTSQSYEIPFPFLYRLTDPHSLLPSHSHVVCGVGVEN